MNLEQLLVQIQEKKLILTENQGEIVIHAPQGAMNSEIMSSFKII